MGNPLFTIRYSSTVPKTQSGTLVGPILSYVAVPQLDPASDTGNIRIINSSYTFPENTNLFSNNITTFIDNAGIAVSNNILITSYYSNTFNNTTLAPIQATKPVTPLWYQFSFANYPAITSQPNGTYIATITDNNGDLVDTNHYILYPSTGVPQYIYTDLINTPDTWYYVNYLTTNNIPIQRFLSVTPIYNMVSTSSPGTNQYTIQYNSPSALWNITTAGNPDIIYSILPIGNTIIQLINPVQASNTSPWYAQITNGYFQRNIITSAGTNSYTYYLPEYQTQAWDPVIPFQFWPGETPIFIDNQTLRLRNIPLRPAGLYPNDLYIYITNSSSRSDSSNYNINTQGNLFDSSVFNPSNNNIPSAIWWRLIVTDIDRNSGLVTIGGIQSADGITTITTGLDADIYQDDILLAFYYYQELDYVFNDINLNPTLDDAVLTAGISVYIRPAIYTTANGSSGSVNSVSDYLLFDQNQIILQASDPLVSLGQTLSAFYSATNGSGIPAIGEDQTTFLELGRIFIRNAATIRNITNGNIVDARIQGGTLMENPPVSIQELINTNTNLMYSLLDWGGIIMPGNSVVVIQLPYYLTYDNYTPQGNALSGANLTNRLLDIRRTVKKNMALGVLPILRFYDAVGNPMDSLNPPLDRVWF